MNVLWITNIAFGKLSEMLGVSDINTSGSWLMASLKDFILDDNFKLTIVTVSDVKTRMICKDANVSYCILPGGYPSTYDIHKKSNRIEWEYIRDTYKPDILQVWGTEFSHGYLALQVMEKIPSVIYMQGLISSISRYYRGGMTYSDILKSITPRDIIKCDWITRSQYKYTSRSHTEAQMIKISKNVIVENNWCATYCKLIEENCVVHKCSLNISEHFYENNWNIDNVIPFTIMSNAAGYPIKGLHILIKALATVVNKYPEAKLLIPGEKSPFNRTFIQKLKETGYSKYIIHLIKNLKLEPNIQFLGKLSSEQMATTMAQSNVFVVPSCIENHSSTLIEAMLVGVPCVASYVGGIPEIVEHNINGMLYRFEEHEILADYICSIFKDKSYAIKLGQSARIKMRSTRNNTVIKDKMISIWDDIIARGMNKSNNKC